MPSRKTYPTIRQYRREDDQEIWALADAVQDTGPTALPGVPIDAPPESLAAELADIGKVFLRSGGDFLVAEVDDHVIGTAGLLLREEGEADVISLAVHPGYRRRGIGSALVETIERRANDLGIRKLNLDVGSNAREAISFYRAVGFDRMDEDDEKEGRWGVKTLSRALRAFP